VGCARTAATAASTTEANGLRATGCGLRAAGYELEIADRMAGAKAEARSPKPGVRSPQSEVRPQCQPLQQLFVTFDDVPEVMPPESHAEFPRRIER
jgi:hypothetical protein